MKNGKHRDIQFAFLILTLTTGFIRLDPFTRRTNRDDSYFQETGIPPFIKGSDPITAPEIRVNGTVQGRSIAISWNETQDATGYLVFIGNSSMNTINDAIIIIQVNMTYIYIDFLEPGNYYIAVMALNDYKFSSMSNQVLITITPPARDDIMLDNIFIILPIAGLSAVVIIAYTRKYLRKGKNPYKKVTKKTARPRYRFLNETSILSDHEIDDYFQFIDSISAIYLLDEKLGEILARFYPRKPISDDVEIKIINAIETQGYNDNLKKGDLYSFKKGLAFYHQTVLIGSTKKMHSFSNKKKKGIVFLCEGDAPVPRILDQCIIALFKIEKELGQLCQINRDGIFSGKIAELFPFNVFHVFIHPETIFDSRRKMACMETNSIDMRDEKEIMGDLDQLEREFHKLMHKGGKMHNK